MQTYRKKRKHAPPNASKMAGLPEFHRVRCWTTSARGCTYSNRIKERPKKGPNLWATICGYFGSKVHTQRKRCQSGFRWLVRQQILFRSMPSESCNVPSPQRNCAIAGSSACSIEYWCPKTSNDPDSTAKLATFPRGHWADIWPQANWTDGGFSFWTEGAGVAVFCTWSGGSTWLGAGGSSGSGSSSCSNFLSLWFFHCWQHRNTHITRDSTTVAIVAITGPGALVAACSRSECASKCWSLVVRDSFQSRERIQPLINWSVWSTTIIYKTSPQVKVLFMDNLRLNMNKLLTHYLPSSTRGSFWPCLIASKSVALSLWLLRCQTPLAAWGRKMQRIHRDMARWQKVKVKPLWWPMDAYGMFMVLLLPCDPQTHLFYRAQKGCKGAATSPVLHASLHCTHLWNCKTARDGRWMYNHPTSRSFQSRSGFVSALVVSSCLFVTTRSWYPCTPSCWLFATFLCGHLKQRQDRPQHNLPTIWTWQWIPSGS